MDVASYIRQIEDQLAGENIALGPNGGWQHFVSNLRRDPKLRLVRATRVVFWLLLIGATIAIPHYGIALNARNCSNATLRGI